MERELFERDRVGLRDQVLLEDYQSEDAFIENLKKRFNGNLIYTYIGQVLISVNPYKELPIYTEEVIQQYRKKHFFEVPPHVFAISDNAFRSLIEEHQGQCILISGESGSGKTETSKKVLQYIAAASGHTTSVESVKDKLLQTNPILESFGNAKTNKNNNSSRFGKYMDIQFNFKGIPDGGNILNYLLEKSRVIHQSPGERNFHIFYQLLRGADDRLLKKLSLKRDFEMYNYLSNRVTTVSLDPTLDDAKNFQIVLQAFDVIEMHKDEQQEILEIVASVLNMGNIEFKEDENGHAVASKMDALMNIVQLLKLDEQKFVDALTHRTIDARGDLVTSPLNKEMAIYARDALAKAIYNRLFDWLVTRINQSLQTASSKLINKNNVLGILDIYGFEIFQTNAFEQFCINFCNEKLQQLFIGLTLKQEQEEYLREGIEWEPVKYFDNKVICNLVEEKYLGIIALLDEECLRPGDATDLTFLDKMNERLADHPHYICHSRASIQIQKLMNRHEFKLRHYAGDVQYSVRGFLDKNNDLLFRDAKEASSLSKNSIMKLLFPKTEFVNKKRPDTAITQFKNSLNNLMDILVTKEPSYIRCIKPNDEQQSDSFNTELIRHQVKYLGLMENLRVRRAGFAYRRTYEMFLQRYKCLCEDTWPHWKGAARDGVQKLVDSLGYQPSEYRMGKTKIFIRFPKTLFATEDAFQHRKHHLAAMIQARWKGRRQREEYLKIRDAIVVFQKYTRRHLAIKERKKRRTAVDRIRYFIKGFITRTHPLNECNGKFIEHVKKQWLLRLAKHLPARFYPAHAHYFPEPSAHCHEASELLKKMHLLHLAKSYRDNLNADKKRQFEMKVIAESKFKDAKKNYGASVAAWFVNERLGANEGHKGNVNAFVKSHNFGKEKLIYTTVCVKYDRHGYKPRERILLLSDEHMYVLDAKTYKQKHRLPLSKLEYFVTKERDGILLIKIPLELKKDKGDLILDIPNIIECCIWIMSTKANDLDMIHVVDTGVMTHNLNGKTGTIEVTTGNMNKTQVMKNKSGNLLVIAAQ